MREEDRKFLLDLAKFYAETPRRGLSDDNPEGARIITITMSDTLALDIACRIRAIAKESHA